LQYASEEHLDFLDNQEYSAFHFDEENLRLGFRRPETNNDAPKTHLLNAPVFHFAHPV